VEVEEWALDLTTGLVGAIRAVRGVLPELRRTPGSSVTLLVGPGMNGELAHASGYGAAQAALARLAETLDTEFGPAGPRVYAVNPGIVPTPLMDHILNSPGGRKWLPRFTEAFGEGKEVGPEAAAELVAWLVARRPGELGGRVIGALGVPEFLETRLARIESEDLGRLRLR
jgi:2-keto-3-deoxy-L-fuconate dehydrogenase